ncbi:unnamed protein product [Lymnaea stagnalis]|uniref:Uncharacterized protein n=1 Tax=Lymnaea stagnalis TaxID=6523 RepID=A0AAV2H017_LYMST
MYLYDYAENSRTTSTTPLTTSTTLSFYIPHVNGREESKHVYIKTTDFTGHDNQHFKPGAWRGEGGHDSLHPDYTPTSRPDYRDKGIVAGKSTKNLAFSPVASWPTLIGLLSVLSLGNILVL